MRGGIHLTRGGPVAASRSAYLTEPDETDTVNVSGLVLTCVRWAAEREASRRSNGAERLPYYPWIVKRGNGATGAWPKTFTR